MGLLDNKVALVTGAGRGNGRAYALALAKEGAKVLVNDIGLELSKGDRVAGLDRSVEPSLKVASSVVEEIRQAGGEAEADCTDIADIDRAAGLVEKAIATFGKIDIVINNAGTLHEATPFDLDNARFDAEFATHVKGTMGTTMAAMRHMRDRGEGGRILNTVSAFSGHEGMAIYSAAKAAVASFTLTSAAEGAPYGITVNGISPVAMTRQAIGYFLRLGLVKSEDDELVAYLGAHNNAPLALFLVSDLSKDITGELFRIGPTEFKMGAPFRIGITNIVRAAEIVSQEWTPQGVADAISGLVPGPSVALKNV